MWEVLLGLLLILGTAVLFKTISLVKAPTYTSKDLALQLAAQQIRTEERLVSQLKTLSDALVIVVSKTEGNILDFNLFALRKLGCTSERLVPLVVYLPK